MKMTKQQMIRDISKREAACRIVADEAIASGDTKKAVVFDVMAAVFSRTIRNLVN